MGAPALACAQRRADAGRAGDPSAGAGAAAQRSRLARFLGPKVDGYLADLQEVVHGKGDGAVAVARGRLEGVADTVLLEFDHVSMLGDSPKPGVRKLREEVLKRLAP